MSTATLEDVTRDVNRFLSIARREPVVISDGGQPEFVWLAVGEYRRLKRLERSVVPSADFSDEELVALERSKPPVEAQAFDHEV